MKQLVITLILFCYVNNTSNTGLKSIKSEYVIDNRKVISKEEFASLISHRESKHNQDTINSSNHYGLFQFGESTLKQLKVDSIKITQIMKGEYKMSKNEQLILFYRYIAFNDRILKEDIIKYDNKCINGVNISNITILAGAHFAGAGGVRLFLRTNGIIDPSDGNIKLSEYIKQFENYKL